MLYSNIPAAQTLVLSFKAWGIKHIVISPGSRNAPLILGFTKHTFFTCYSIVDERCAAFFALGMAQQLQEPVAVVCTSGSAVLNYYPAVAEAFYSDIPLVVVSADRPLYKVDIGDGQTIRQNKVLNVHVGYSAVVKQDVSHASAVVARYKQAFLYEDQQTIQQYNEKEIAKALQTTIRYKTPVHINIPFEEPLYGLTQTPGVTIPERRETADIPPQIQDWSALQRLWNTSTRKMVLVGVHPPEALDKKVLEALASDDSVLVFTETTSNLHHPNFFPGIDSILAPVEKSEQREALFRALQPDLLVTFGGLIVSKKIKAFVRTYSPKAHWHIDSKKAYNTFFCLSQHVKTHPNTFFKVMTQSAPVESDYKQRWQAIKQNYEARRTVYLQQIPFSDFTVFEKLIRGIPQGYQVHLANSSAVRYAQLFSMHPTLHVYCNRGTAGIDGSTSTAVGASIYYAKPTLLLTGDLSFLYDSNGLWNTYIRADFRIILINNAGGGIFKILPGNEETEEFSTFFETHHRLTAEHLATMYGFEYYKAANREALQQGLREFYNVSQHPKILEVVTPRNVNHKVLLEYFEFLSHGL